MLSPSQIVNHRQSSGLGPTARLAANHDSCHSHLFETPSHCLYRGVGVLQSHGRTITYDSPGTRLTEWGPHFSRLILAIDSDNTVIFEAI